MGLKERLLGEKYMMDRDWQKRVDAWVKVHRGQESKMLLYLGAGIYVAALAICVIRLLRGVAVFDMDVGGLIVLGTLPLLISVWEDSSDYVATTKDFRPSQLKRLNLLEAVPK